MSEPLPPLRRNRDFQLLWAGLAVSVVGSRISAVAYPLLVLAQTGSAADAGLVGFMATLPFLVVQLPAGVLVDRVNRKVLMLVCDAGRALAVGTLIAALLLGGPTLAHIMAVAFVQGALQAAFQLAESTAVRHVVPAAQLPTALAQNEARNRGAGVAGTPLGGFLFDLGRIVPFVADAVSYLVSFVAVLLIRRRDFHGEREARRTHVLADVWEGVTWLWRQPLLRASALVVAGSNFLFQALVLALIVTAKEHGASPTVIGVMLSGAGVGGVAGALIAPWIQRRVPAKVVILGANWLWAVLIPPMALVEDPYALGALWAAGAFVGPAWNVVLGTYQLVVTPERLLGRVSSAETLIAWGAIPLGSLAAGFLLDSIGAAPTIWALCGWMVFVAVAATFVRSLREAPNLDTLAAAAPT